MAVRNLKQIFGQNIKFYRGLKGWSQEYLAEEVGVSKNTICEIETGKKFVKAETLENFAEVFETDVYKLFVPEDVLYKDVNGVLAKYTEEVKDAVERLRDSYLGK